MSVDHNYPQLAIDHRTFTDALGDGALGICLDYLRQRQIHGAEEARLAVAERATVKTTVHTAFRKMEQRGTIVRIAPQGRVVRWQASAG